MSESDAIRLRHMLEASLEAIDNGSGQTSDDLRDDRVRALALVRCVEIVGEAGTRVSEECPDSHPEIPWRAVIGMRNRLVHAYFDIDFRVVCDTVQDDLPALVAALKEVLASGE